MTRRVAIQLLVDWDFNGNYTNESAYVIAAEGSFGYAPLHKSLIDGRGVVDSMTVTLNNASGRFASMITTAPLYAYLSGGQGYNVPMQLNVSLSGGSVWFRVFTGVAKLPLERTATPNAIRTVTLNCRSRDEQLLQRRSSTPMVNMVAYNENGYSESALIQAWLEQAGYSASDFEIDPGTYTIPWAWLDDESPLEDIWALAAAAGGRFYCDPEGIFRYENAAHNLSMAGQGIYLTRDTFTDLELEWQDSEMYNVITVETAPRQLGATALVWEPDETISIPVGESHTALARFRQPVMGITAFPWRAKTANSVDITSWVTLAAPTYYAQRVEFTWTNTHPSRAAHLYGVRLYGVPLVGGPSQDVSVKISNSFWTQRGDRVKSLRGNPYIQSRAQANSLAQFLAGQCATPRLSITARNVRGVPGIRLGQVVTVSDSLLFSSDRTMMLTRVAWRANSAGFAQDLTGLDVTGGLYPRTAYFKLNSDRLSANPDPVFY